MKFWIVPLIVCAALMAQGKCARADVRIASNIPDDITVEHARLQLKSLDIRIEVKNGFARTTSTWTFSNSSLDYFGAALWIDVPEGVVPSRLALVAGGERAESLAVPRARAELFPRWNKDLFPEGTLAAVAKTSPTLLLANIPSLTPRRDVGIEVVWVAPLEQLKEAQQLEFPLSVSTPPQIPHWTVQVEGAIATTNFGVLKDGFLAGGSQTPLPASLQFHFPQSTGARFIKSPTGEFASLNSPLLGATDMLRVGQGAQSLFVGQLQSLLLDDNYFGDVARTLWASAKLNALQQKGRLDEADKLAQESGLLGPNTDWWALSPPAHSALDRYIKQNDVQEAGKKYAHAVALGDSKTALEQSQLFTRLKDEILVEAQDSGLQYWFPPTLVIALNNELSPLNDQLEKENDPTRRALLLRQVNNLKQAGATFALARQSPAKRDQQENERQLQLLGARYLAEVEVGHNSSKLAKSLRARLTTIARKQHTTFSHALGKVALARGAELASRIINERAQNNSTPTRERDWNTRLARLGALANVKTSPAKFLLVAQQQFLSDHEPALIEKAAQAVRDGASIEQALREYDTAASALETSIGAKGVARSDATNAVLDTASIHIMSEIQDGQGDRPDVVQLAQDIERLDKAQKLSVAWRIKGGWSLRASLLADELLQEQIEHGATSTHALQLQSEFEATFPKGKGVYYEMNTPDDYFRSSAYRFRRATNTLLAQEISAHRENEPFARSLQDELTRLYTLNPKYAISEIDGRTYADTNDLVIKAWSGRAHEAAYRLLSAPDQSSASLGPVRAELELAAKNAGKTSDAILKWESARRAKGLPLLTVQEYRLRPGDPLIAVRAPANARRVLAVLPTGELLPLRFNVRSGQWEARFDVPTFLPEGEFPIHITTVFTEGRRSLLIMRLHVDLSAPTKVATLKFDPQNPRLELECDAATDRVSAFLPAGERIELKRGVNGLWSAALPPHAVVGESVRLILTDAAHNRTEITLDLAASKAQ